MYFHGLSKDEILSKKYFESYEESCKRSQMKMVTLLGQKVYSSKDESFESGNGQVNRNCLNMNHETEGTDRNWFGRRSGQVITSCGSGLLDLNETPVNELVADNQQCFFQDLNIPYTEVTDMSCEKSGLDDVNEKDSAASCCTVENNSINANREDSSEVTQMAAECLVYISTILLNQSQNIPLKHGSSSNSLYQDQGLFIKPEMDHEKPEYSCDSYELHTLGICETNLEEDFCVSSKAVDEFNNKKEFGVKVRRGRRMKNFQKEILPGLVSLSRHDIHEDLNILEAILRSKEYKKTSDENGKPNSRNNKGSAQKYVGRRRRRTV